MTAGNDAAGDELATRIREKLTSALAPEILELRDDSARHAGHREAAGRRHMRLRIVSRAFAGRSLRDRHRIVYGLLESELAGELHALEIRALTPDEDAL